MKRTGDEAALEDASRLLEISACEVGVAELVEGLTQAGGAGDLFGKLDSLATVSKGSWRETAMAFE